jgi:hypothetical protein
MKIQGEFMHYLLTLLLVLSNLTAMATEKVIYGEDDRLDVYEVKNQEYIKLSLSTAAMIPNSKIKKDFGLEN